MSLELSQRLRERRQEIEAAILTRVYSVDDPTEVGDSEYLLGLKGAVSSAVSHALSALDDRSGDREGPVPAELLAQARRAARSGVGLDTVLRRYVAGHSLLCEFLLQEGRTASVPALQRALRKEASLVDRIVAKVTEAYEHEIDRRHKTAEHRRAERVEKILAGEPLDALELEYDLEGWHLGVVAHGPGSPQAMRELAAALDRRLLLVRPAGNAIWGWLGGRSRLAARALAEQLEDELRVAVTLAIGEPGHGIAGWRLTHRQARAALPVALRDDSRVVSYSDVAVLSSVLGDEVLVASLHKIYLAPLAGERGAVLRETLRAYFEARGNTASAAAALGINRQTVARRLDTVERRIGRELERCGAEVEIALRLSDLGVTDACHPKWMTASSIVDAMSN